MDGKCLRSYLWGGFKWDEKSFQFNEFFIKSYNEDSDVGYFIEGDIKYSKKLLKLDNDLQFLPKRMKTENVETLVPKLFNNKKYLIHIRNSKQALNHD